MKYAPIILMLLPALLWAQDYQFQREWDSVQVQIGNYTLPAAWTGGYTRTCPNFCDIDADGDLDAFIGSFNGRLEFWENQGSAAQFQFVLADPAFQGLDSLQATWPEFWDMDADGDLDLFLYCYGIRVYENYGDLTSPELVLVDTILQDIQGNPIGGTDPALVDIDADGDQDLFIGTFSYGYLKYYENIGDSIQYAYSLSSSNYLGSGTGEWCSPEFCDIDADGDYDLFIGDWYGRIWYYRNDGTPQQAQFTLVTSYWLNIDVGNYAAPDFADMDGDGDYDLWVGRDVYDHGSGNTPGDVYYFENIGTPQLPQFQQVRASNLTLDAGTGNIPKLNDFNAGANLDLLFSNDDYLIYYENTGTSQQPFYELVSEDVLPDFQPYAFDLYDLDADGDLDLICANGMLFSAEIIFYENVGGPQNPIFRYAFTIPDLPYTALWPVSLADMDADGDGDLIVGTWGNGLVYFQNQGMPQVPNFVLQTENWQNIPSQRSPCLVDMDLDGDYDLLAGMNVLGLVEFWENVGTPQNAQMVLADSDFCGNVHSPKPAAADLDNDGDIDLLVGSSTDGGIYFFRNVTGEIPGVRPGRQTTAPYRGPVLSIGPNPANPLTVISCQLPAASSLSLEIFDISGKKVIELASGFHLPGEYRYVWDASKNASGMYVIRLKTAGESLAEKLVITK